MPDEGAEEDLWLVLMTLGRLASQASDVTTALVARTAAAHAAVIASLPAEARTAREALFAAMAQ